VSTNKRTLGLCALRQLFPPTPGQPDRLLALLEAVGPIESDDKFLELCDGIEHLRNIVAHHALDRQNDLPPQKEVEQYRNLALAIEALGITGDPPTVREQMRDHLVTGFEEVEGPNGDADSQLRQSLRQLIRLAPALYAAASQVEREQASGDLQWWPKTPIYIPSLLENIETLWVSVFGRKASMSVNRKTVGHDQPSRSVAGGPFLRFAVAVLELLGLPADPNNLRQAILRDRQQRRKVEQCH
jgi:hypothetical protein